MYRNIRAVSKTMLIAIILMTILKIPIVYAIESDLSNSTVENAQSIANDEATIGSGDNPGKSPEKKKVVKMLINHQVSKKLLFWVILTNQKLV